eukprot:scaffold60520_cov20-Prasinocladus_malaysianus.AAC.2
MCVGLLDGWSLGSLAKAGATLGYQKSRQKIISNISVKAWTASSCEYSMETLKESAAIWQQLEQGGGMRNVTDVKARQKIR